MQRRLSLLVVLCGCNQVFGLQTTQPIDAAYFDAPPSVCPPIGTPPPFTEDFHQALLQNCTDYTVSSNGRALARCNSVISEGMVGGEVSAAIGLEPPMNVVYERPRLSADGRLAVIRVFDRTTSTTVTSFDVFTRGEAGWTKRDAVPADSTMSISSAVSRDGRLLVSVPSGYHELQYVDGTWNAVLTHDTSELGVISFGPDVSLTPDALRLVFVGQLPGSGSLQLLYSDRPSIDVPFSKAVAMPPIDYLSNAFLTEDCARLYFYGLGTVFYVTP